MCYIPVVYSMFYISECAHWRIIF